MDWTKVTFDLDNDQPPGIEPQCAFADRAMQDFEAPGQPKGFALYDLSDHEAMLFYLFFSPIAAQHFAEFIKSHRNEIWK